LANDWNLHTRELQPAHDYLLASVDR